MDVANFVKVHTITGPAFRLVQVVMHYPKRQYKKRIQENWSRMAVLIHVVRIFDILYASRGSLCLGTQRERENK